MATAVPSLHLVCTACLQGFLCCLHHCTRLPNELCTARCHMGSTVMVYSMVLRQNFANRPSDIFTCCSNAHARADLLPDLQPCTMR